MNKLHHPTNRAERLRMKHKKEHTFEQLGRSRRIRKHAIEEIETKELEDELRREISLPKEPFRDQD